MILDIGSGHNPFKKADVLIENYYTGDAHRWDKKIVADRPTILYDGRKIPFKDKSFDFSTCIQVLEHVDSPRIFLKEIERVSVAGYIETPSEIAELIFTPYDKHKWVIFFNGETLLIKRKIPENNSKLGRLFDFICETEKDFETFFYWKRRGLFVTEYYWNGNINFKILKETPECFNDFYNINTIKKMAKVNRIPYVVRCGFRKSNKNRTRTFLFLEKNLITPCCGMSGLFEKKYFICQSCFYKYTISGHLIKLIKD